MDCIQRSWKWGPNLSLLTFKIHILKSLVAILRHFPKAYFILGHPLDTFCILQVMYEWNDSKITQCDQIVWFNWVENWYDREVYWEIQGLHS